MVKHIRSIYVGTYRHNNEGFHEKIIYQMSINKERMNTTQDAHASLVEILSLVLFISW